MDKQINHHKSVNEKLAHEIALLKRFKFSKRSEQLSPDQASLLDDLIDTDTENEVRPVEFKFLAERGLTLSKEKTKITHIGNRFDFFGWNVRKYNGKLMIKPSKANISAHLPKLQEEVKVNKKIRQANLIWRPNPVLRDWASLNTTKPREPHQRYSTLLFSMTRCTRVTSLR